MPNQHSLLPECTRRRAIAGVMTGLGAFSLPHVLRLRAEAARRDAASPPRRIILLWQDGGPSHHETFDPKPLAPVEYRGELEAISTLLPGIQFCEILPKLAKLADRFSIVRSYRSNNSGHTYQKVASGGNATKATMGALYARSRVGGNRKDGPST